MKIIKPAFLLFAAFCFALSLATSAIAQDGPRKGTVNVPFDFFVGPDKMPAGQYEIEAVSPTQGIMRSKDGKLQSTMYFIPQGDGNPIQQAKLVFAVRDGKYILSQVWGWFGKTQFSGFYPQNGDGTKDVPIKLMTAAAKPAK